MSITTPCSHITSPFCTAQFYALGVASEGALDVYVGISPPPEHLHALASGAHKANADQAAARVAEAVVLESLIHWQRKAGLVTNNRILLRAMCERCSA
jgi:hypothetical protein